MLRVSNLSKTYGNVVAVAGLDFELAAGQNLALIGPSGCGKTTTLKMLNRLVEPSGGRVELAGEDTRRLPPEQLRRRMGYVIQGVGLFPHYRVADNVAVAPRLLGWSPDRIRRRVNALLEQMGLPPGEYAHRYPHQLSGGQQQRVGIARALAADPPLILMDEPFGALDPLTRADLRRDFMQLEALSAKTIVLVTHDVEEAVAMGSCICLLDQGRVQQLGAPAELLSQPANAFVRRFFADKWLELQLQTIQLGELAAHLPAAEAAQGPQLAPNTRVRAALAILADLGPQGAASLPHAGGWRVFGAAELWQALLVAVSPTQP